MENRKNNNHCTEASHAPPLQSEPVPTPPPPPPKADERKPKIRSKPRKPNMQLYVPPAKRNQNISLADPSTDPSNSSSEMSCTSSRGTKKESKRPLKRLTNTEQTFASTASMHHSNQASNQKLVPSEKVLEVRLTPVRVNNKSSKQQKYVKNCKNALALTKEGTQLLVEDSESDKEAVADLKMVDGDALVAQPEITKPEPSSISSETERISSDNSNMLLSDVKNLPKNTLVLSSQEQNDTSTFVSNNDHSLAQSLLEENVSVSCTVVDIVESSEVNGSLILETYQGTDVPNCESELSEDDKRLCMKPDDSIVPPTGIEYKVNGVEVEKTPQPLDETQTPEICIVLAEAANLPLQNSLNDEMDSEGSFVSCSSAELGDSNEVLQGQQRGLMVTKTVQNCTESNNDKMVVSSKDSGAPSEEMPPALLDVPLAVADGTLEETTVKYCVIGNIAEGYENLEVSSMRTVSVDQINDDGEQLITHSVQSEPYKKLLPDDQRSSLNVESHLTQLIGGGNDVLLKDISGPELPKSPANSKLTENPVVKVVPGEDGLFTRSLGTSSAGNGKECQKEDASVSDSVEQTSDLTSTDNCLQPNEDLEEKSQQNISQEGASKCVADSKVIKTFEKSSAGSGVPEKKRTSKKSNSHKQSSSSGQAQVPKSPIAASDTESWDCLFDENGDCLKPDVLNELTSALGRVKVEKPGYDYYDFQPHDPDVSGETFGHIVEIYDFPAEFKTNDLLAAFSDFRTQGFTIKWVDDTHALGVFASPLVAADALELQIPFIKVRPLSQAIRESKLKAKRCAEFLQPYKPRPETSAHLARRLVTGALGLRANITKEQREQEKQQLREARERKKQAAKQKQDLWDGVI